MTTRFEYCVAIRTLGQAGDKFRTELESLHAQTIAPQRILVYLAEGYPRPSFTVGSEEYISCEKGMVAQRALPFTEVSTPYVLFLDDDVYLPPTAVETLAEAMLREQADCVAADTFHPHADRWTGKVRAFITNMAYPRRNDAWAFKICRNASFSYNGRPAPRAYRSQSAAGPASLWRMEAFRNIHFSDERWLDNMGFAYGDDMLYYYKLHLNGGRLLVHYASGITHLDAQSSRKAYSEAADRLYKRAFIWFVLWYRICYNLRGSSRFQRLLAACAYGVKLIWGGGIHTLYALMKLKPRLLWMFIKGNINAWRYVHSATYRAVPNFKLP